MTSRPPAPATFRFSSTDWERDRWAMCREAFGRTVFTVDMGPTAGDQSYADAQVRMLPGLQIVSGAIANLHVGRPRELLDGRDDLILALTASGVRMVSQRGREMTLRTGDAVLMSNTEASTSTFASLARSISLWLPRRALVPFVPGLEDAVMSPLPANTEALRLLTRYVEELDDGYPLATPELQRLVVAHVYDLVALAIGATRDAAALAERRGLHAARLAAIKADISENLDQSDLSLAAVAMRQRLTPRNIQRLFASEGTTFSDFVLGERLARAHRLLTDPRGGDRAISLIAFEAGFGDLSYFNRTFRRRYGESPSETRAAARREQEG